MEVLGGYAQALQQKDTFNGKSWPESKVGIKSHKKDLTGS
jgi:hypothetical protein